MFIVIGADGKEYGPIPRERVIQWQAEGRLNAQSRMRAADQAEWKTLADFPEFASTPASSFVPAPLPSQPSSLPRVNPLATASFVLGIISVTFGWCCCCGYPISVSGIVFGVIALFQIKNSGGREGGKSLAIAGLVCSITALLIGLTLRLLGVAIGLLDVFKNLK